MFNSGGAVEQFEVQKTSKSEVNGDQATPLSENRPVSATVPLKVQGCGRFNLEPIHLNVLSSAPLMAMKPSSLNDFKYAS